MSCFLNTDKRVSFLIVYHWNLCIYPSWDPVMKCSSFINRTQSIDALYNKHSIIIQGPHNSNSEGCSYST